MFWLLGTAATLGMLAFASGYFDADVTDERRWIGCGLIVTGIATGWPAVLRLVDDWPRMKPQPNVELAFLQISVAVAVLIIASMLGGRFGVFLAPLVESPPKSTGWYPGASKATRGAEAVLFVQSRGRHAAHL